MGRLIDADALLQKFNDKGIQITFDLPVEEILGEDVDIDDFTMLVQDAIQAYRKMVIGTIKEQPTAYDVEKVVELIDRRIEFLDGVNKICFDAGDFKAADKNADRISEVIAIKEIVRKGGEM